MALKRSAAFMVSRPLSDLRRGEFKLRRAGVVGFRHTVRGTGSPGVPGGLSPTSAAGPDRDC